MGPRPGTASTDFAGGHRQPDAGSPSACLDRRAHDRRPCGHTATLLLDGTLLAAGGRSGPTGAVDGSAERYDPQNDAWTATESMAVPRQGHAATLLQDGTVLVTGGVDNNGQLLASAELYDPDTRTWSLTGDMTGSRIGHTATLLADGSVLVAGAGEGEDGQRSAEVYDPLSRTWMCLQPA